MSCHLEVLNAARRVVSQNGCNLFFIEEIIDFMCDTDTKYAESTIKTYITSRCCLDSVGPMYDYFYRGDEKGAYKLNDQYNPLIKTATSLTSREE